MQAFLQHLFSVAAIVVTATGCASTGELNAVEARVIELEKFEEHVRQLSERDTTRFQNLSNQIKDAADALSKAGAGLQAQLSGVQDDERKLRGRLEELEHLTGRLSAQVKTMGKFLDQRFGLSVIALPPDLPDEAEPLFQYGVQVFTAGQYDLARAVFRHFLTHFEPHEKADFATIQVARSYRQQKRYKQALREYSGVYKKYASVARKNKPPVLDIVLWESAETLNLWGQCAKARKMYRHLGEFKHLKRAARGKARAKSMRCK